MVMMKGMDSRRLVMYETKIVLLGEVICVAAMLGIFALLGKFGMSVLLGGLIGGLLSVANFFFMAVNAVMAGDKAAGQDMKGGKKLIRLSYTVRVIILFGVLFAVVKSGVGNVFASVLPLLFVRPIITIAEFFRKKDA